MSESSHPPGTSPSSPHGAEHAPDFVAKLRAGKAILFRPRGNSMRPAIADGTVTMIDPVRRDLRVGDVVLALLGDHVVLHRVMAMDGDQVWLMGDAHRHSEGPLAHDHIVGIARVDAFRGYAKMAFLLRRILFFVTHLGKR